ncbi:hypothetical protein Atai01_78650 [Amycolatopsis taiwanensis]|uniref:Uncharacterized protein n=1 Tax=Amycolatopsis taiwanensis TaxID=342230 RepID=A0A9W6R8E3_9PSEU|nr:hypothetical protein Atai01_78650 [Amycolatopsis taiwanensis]
MAKAQCAALPVLTREDLGKLDKLFERQPPLPNLLLKHRAKPAGRTTKLFAS